VQLGKNNSKSGAWRPRDVAAAADCKTTLLLPLEDNPSALLSTPILSLLLIHSLSLPYKQKTHSNINNNQTQNPKPKKKSTTAAALQSTKSHDFLSRERE
jgi:hypothetical protein